MKPKTKRYVFSLSLSVVVFLLIALFLHVGHRYHALIKLTRLPFAQQRIAIRPSRKVFSETKISGQIVDLGYCVFYFPPGMSVEKNIRGVQRTSVVIANEDLSLEFMPPFKENPMVGVQTEIYVEESEYPDFWEVMFLCREQFGALIAALGHKASTTRGWNEVYSYTTANTVGLVRIGDLLDDRLHASGSISALRGNRHVGFHLHINPKSTIIIDDVLEHVISTFKFTIDSIPDEQALATIILRAIRDHSL